MTSGRGFGVLGLSLAIVAGVQGRAHAWYHPPLVQSADQKPALAPPAAVASSQKAVAPTVLPPDQKYALPSSPSSSLPSAETVQKPAGPVSPPVAHQDDAPVLPPGAQKAAPVSTAPSALSPTQLGRGPSLYETGRVGNMAVSEPGVRAGHTGARVMPKELPVEAKIMHTDPAVPTPGVVNTAVLGREIKSRFTLLKDCPTEVARQKRAAPDSISASRLTLRWTILPNGRIADTQAVATSPVNGHVLDCVKRQMSQWVFSPPKGGSVRVERLFRFRSSAPHATGSPEPEAGSSD
jgi:cytoskeletal protein RodZ